MRTAALPRPTRPDSRSLHPSQRQLSVGILSTFPPTQCGLATFAAALVNGMRRCGVLDIGIVAVGDDERVLEQPGVVSMLCPADAVSVVRTAQMLNRYDVVIIQHEYGIYGGDDGDELLEVMRRITKPVIVTLHTVPLQPSAHQKKVLESVVNEADVAVTMTSIARQRLTSVYSVDSTRVATVPHGAFIPSPAGPRGDNPPSLLTWGLLGPGKGIEWVIDALALLKGNAPPVRYVIAGQTHPKVREREGESYRRMLQDKVRRAGLVDQVVFDSEYRTVDSLTRMITRSTCVVLPYESIDQITSGVLVDAVAAGKPVIATAFPHAVELLSGGAGILVPPRNADAMGRAIARVATDPAAVSSMASRSAALAPMHDWTAVARCYHDIGAALSARHDFGVLA